LIIEKTIYRMDMSMGKYVRLLIGAAVITYVYIRVQKDNKINKLEKVDLSGRKEIAEWNDSDTNTLLGGTFFGAIAIEVVLQTLNMFFGESD
jgi:hypothetical protein